MTNETTFTLADVLNAQKALRESAGAKEEPLELPDLVGIAAEEIDLLQEQGKSWDAIAATIQSATGKAVTGIEVERAYESLDESERWDDDDDDDDDRDR
jgi:hypothetical protein